MLREEHHLAQLFLYPVAIVFFDEKVLQALWRHIDGDRRGVNLFPRRGERLLIDTVAIEDLNRGRFSRDRKVCSARNHRRRRRFFSGCASGRPYPDLIVGTFRCEQLRDDFLSQELDEWWSRKKFVNVISRSRCRADISSGCSRREFRNAGRSPSSRTCIRRATLRSSVELCTG